jgi:hypothetical protein
MYAPDVVSITNQMVKKPPKVWRVFMNKRVVNGNINEGVHGIGVTNQ